MEFLVFADNYTDPDHRREAAGSHVWWPGETAHLAVDGAPVTLCAEPVSRFVPIDGVRHDDDDVPWCWACKSTAN